MNQASAQGERKARLVYGLFVLGVGAFVVSSTTQVALAIFRDPAADPFPKVGQACGEGIEELAGGVDAATLEALHDPRADDARRRYSATRQSKWQRYEQIERVCAADPNGGDALAAVARLDREAESAAVRHVTELSPVRIRVQSFISGHPR